MAAQQVVKTSCTVTWTPGFLQPCYQRTPGSCLSATPASLPAVVKAVSSCILAKSFFFYLRQNRYLLQMAAVMRIKYDKACEHFAEWLGENKCSRSVSQETLRSVVCGNLQSWSGECTEVEPFQLVSLDDCLASNAQISLVVLSCHFQQSFNISF